MSDNDTRNLKSVKDVLRDNPNLGDRLGISDHTIRRWAKKGHVTAYKKGPQRVLVDADEVNAVALRRFHETSPYWVAKANDLAKANN